MSIDPEGQVSMEFLRGRHFLAWNSSGEFRQVCIACSEFANATTAMDFLNGDAMRCISVALRIWTKWFEQSCIERVLSAFHIFSDCGRCLWHYKIGPKAPKAFFKVFKQSCYDLMHVNAEVRWTENVGGGTCWNADACCLKRLRDAWKFASLVYVSAIHEKNLWFMTRLVRII